MHSTFKGSEAGKFKLTAGKFYGDAEKDKGTCWRVLFLAVVCLIVIYGIVEQVVTFACEHVEGLAETYLLPAVSLV